MSTRATITAKMPEGGYVSFYKHHDGYIENGLGEALMQFVAFADYQQEPFTLETFTQFVNDTKCVNPVGFDEIEIIKSNYDLWAQEQFKSHADTEFHYTIERRNGKNYLLVQKRDWENGSQNGANLTETGHWTDFAEKEMIGATGLFIDNHLE